MTEKYRQRMHLSLNFAYCAAISIVAVFLPACTEPIEMDSLLDQHEDLCASDAAFQEAVARCRTSDCEGVASLSGTVRGEPVAATDESVRSTSLQKIHFVDGDVDLGIVSDLFVFRALGDYNDFLFEFKDIDSPPADDSEFTLTPGNPDDGFSRTTDGKLRGSVRVSNGTESMSLLAVPGSGHLVLKEISSEVVRGSFEMAFEDERDVLTGCFEFYPAEVNSDYEDVSGE